MEWFRTYLTQGSTNFGFSTTPKTRAEGLYLRQGWRHSPPHPEGKVRMVLRASWQTATDPGD